jgi:basic amino acid/polyamine antiporter, APA family
MRTILPKAERMHNQRSSSPDDATIVFTLARSPLTLFFMNATPSEKKPGLERALGPLVATAVVVGTVIGSGVFKKPATIAAKLGGPEALRAPFSLVALVWIIGGVFVILGALAYAEVTVLYPRAGGNYVFLREGYGRLFGFLWGWVEFWIIRTASLAALATIFTESLHDVLKNTAVQHALGIPIGSELGFWSQRGITVGVLLALAGVNILGVRWGGGLQLFITLVKVCSLLAIAVLPFVVFGLAPPDSTVAKPNIENLQSAGPNVLTLSGINAAFLGVLWAYHGWMNIAPVAEEVRRPQRNLPLALLCGVGIIIFLYLSANVSYALVIPNLAKLEATKTTSTAFCESLLGPFGAVAASAVLMCSVFGALNGNLLVGPRLLYAMGKDGLAPRALSDVHPRFHTPALAIAVLAGWSALLVLGVAFLTHIDVLDARVSHFDLLTDFAMFGAVIFETMAVVSIFVFRYRFPAVERPYRCVGYPVTPAIYVLLPSFVLLNMLSAVFLSDKMSERMAPMVGVGFIALGVVVYYALGLSRTGPVDVPVPPLSPEQGPSRLEPKDAVETAKT